MKEIALTQGKVAIVDDDVYEYESQWEWNAYRSRNTWYAKRMDGRKTIRMHREIMNAPDGIVVDHWDGNGLNNCRENLRLCTNAQNLHNQKGGSGYRGACWSNKDKTWYGFIRFNRTKIYLGSFETPEQAARAYDAAAKQYFGEFARTNF